MTRSVRVAVQIQPGGAPDYRSWRDAVLAADDLGVDVIFGYDHFHRPAMEAIVDGKPVLSDEQPDVANFEGWTALASWGRSPRTPRSGSSSPASAIATRICSLTWLAPSTTSAAAGSFLA